MATKFPKFSQGLAQDPTTRRIWYGIATAHDFESHDNITEENSVSKNICFPFWAIGDHLPMDVGEFFPCCLARKLSTMGARPSSCSSHRPRNLGSSLWSTRR